jgi:uncharacterized protein with PIN domain
MQANNSRFHSSWVERKEKAEATLAKLQSLKNQISELRMQCEALKKRQSETQRDFTCSECGKLIEPGQEVVLKGSLGKLESYYHRDCFKAIWLSQSWTLDYSEPGFLRKLDNR